VSVTPVARDDDSAEFFDAAARGELLILHCPACGSDNPPQASTCVRCAGPELAPTTAEGSGRLVSWTLVPSRSGDAAQPPTIVGLVELTEGPWLIGNVSEVDPAALEVGYPVGVAFERPTPESEVVPYFVARRSR
jgi:uncharacterized OB-fold protein